VEEQPKLLSIPKAAKAIGVDTAAVRAWVMRTVNPLPSVVSGEGTGKYVRRKVVMSEVDEWLRTEAQREGCTS